MALLNWGVAAANLPWDAAQYSQELPQLGEAEWLIASCDALYFLFFLSIRFALFRSFLLHLCVLMSYSLKNDGEVLTFHLLVICMVLDIENKLMICFNFQVVDFVDFLFLL